MMRLKYLFFTGIIFSMTLFSCSDDDDEVEEVPERDRGEQAIEDDEALRAYLETHFYNYEDFENPGGDFDYVIRFDTIAGDNSDKTPIIDSENLIQKTYSKDDVDYNLYVLKVREGVGEQPTFADSTLVTYRGELLNRSTFDNAKTPVWFDQLGLIDGFTQGVVEFKGASGYSVNDDNTVNFNNDYGIGAVFFPSGLGYFSNSQASIPAYSPLIFSINLLSVNESDHDGDGIPSWMEDLDGDGDLRNDDTDEDDTPNYADSDDDGDGTPTREEIIINEDGSLEFPDTNDNGIPDYLDPDTF
ncbi:FKBP-type peptidyl-prolyl cis-trans isomerase [Salegentibacter sp.]|uniref:FKBP-type peptidyl-prolyl cis-trans isomerase n=1 Tax=Salegentibacter sp. TaxID=1903072 RepID=UPI00356358D4